MAIANAVVGAISLEGQSAIVTGAGRGIGRAIAMRFAEAGAKIVLAARTAEQVEAVHREIVAAGGEAIAVPTDVTVDEQVHALVEQAQTAFGGIDVLVNNAGRNPFIVPTHEARLDGVDKVFAVNWRGPYLLSQLCGQRMIEEGRGGAIVQILSQSAWMGVTGNAPYGGAKAALMRASEAMACEWGEFGIRVNCIGPGFIQTDMTRRQWEDPERLAAVKRTIPLGRIGQPQEIANISLFLVSDLSSFVTGQTIWAEGGQGPVRPGG